MSTLSPAGRPANPTRPAQLANALWAALAHGAGVEGDRNGLPSCAAFSLDLRITGTINGAPVDQAIAGMLDVGRLKPARPSRHGDVEAANRLLTQLHRAQRSPAPGAVRFNYTLAADVRSPAD